MNISYSYPLSLAFQRMKKALFQPFDPGKWFRIGFTAWLAGLTDCHGGSSGNNSKFDGNNLDDFFRFPETAVNWLTDHPLWANLIIAGVVLLILIVSVIMWISARGKFTFLYNVANNEAEIGKPWHGYRKEGNSLFIFEFFFGWFAFALFALFIAYCFVSARDLYYADAKGLTVFLAVLQMVLLLIGYLLTIGYTSLFLKDFVVPIMYKQRIGVMRAWGKFLVLFGRKFFAFLIYGLFIFILGMAVAIGVILLALLTCCIGLLLIGIPYIGAVILLPVSYTFRALSLEFLAQFGAEFNVFPPEEDENPIPIIQTD